MRIKYPIALSLILIAGVAWGEDRGIKVKKLNDRIENRFETDQTQYVVIKSGGRFNVRWSPSRAGKAAEIIWPIANAGDDVSACNEAEVTLSSSGSYDPMGMDLSIKWTWVSKPAGSEAVINNSNNKNCYIIPDQLGIYTVGLNVRTGDNREASDIVVITVSDCDYRPKAVIDGPGEVCDKMPITFRLDGSDSHTREGDIVRYNWAVESSPSSLIEMTDNGREIDITVDMPGMYEISLTVENSLGLSSETVYYKVKVSDGDPPQISGAGTRKTISALLLKRDTVKINIYVRYLSDCRKVPAKYIYAMRALGELEYNEPKEISSNNINSNEDTGVSSFEIAEECLIPGTRYYFLIAGVTDQGEVLTFKEMSI
jgi:hypothetical protein